MTGTAGRRKGTNLVARTAGTLRERIFAQAPGTLLGSLHELARELEVGIVTLQQAARVLEHEGLLEVRRGPGGGYYGARPDDAALERALSSYMRMNPAGYEEALDMTSLLFTELATAAAGCTSTSLRARLKALGEEAGQCRDMAEFGRFEEAFQELLFQMVRRPLFEMLTRVTLHHAALEGGTVTDVAGIGVENWRDGRRRIIAAILSGDPDLARFEANRQNRAVVMAQRA
ncbi:DNA-binding FadR family transcriptional regulator [Novosphingobium sp. PhB165]|uniref:FadR/GntR family transcriptional regulator n=1 Tax=Novosphingobium sp. PhB165 TaxID=2485105 RepID=UPI0010EC4C46|nr:FCD domain-containing protein [Novosphingobium sp. PhB165]TCM21668.1 DNA-binding FadR family transcriptional regulator [Novosphingobium sp. PhB165]